MKLLNLRGSAPDKYALSLMDALFDEEEMAAQSQPSHPYPKTNWTRLKVYAIQV